MNNIAIARAAHLILYVDAAREIGAPIERQLALAKLPTLIEETPDAYFSVPLALDFATRCANHADISELAFSAARRSSLRDLSSECRLAVLGGVNGLARIGGLMRMAAREDTALVIRAVREAADVRVICDFDQFRDDPGVVAAEWLHLNVVISIVRSVAGPNWCPSEMTFMSRDRVCETALRAFGNSRMLTGQPNTSILIPWELLAAPCSRHCVEPGEAPSIPAPPLALDDNFVATLRLAIQPYLGDRYPDLDLAAEIAGLSRRTFQRELARHGRTYSGVIREARFDTACALLVDPAVKIIEVAYAAGYENPQHFSRAFRGIAGMSPRHYRRHFAGVQ